MGTLYDWDAVDFVASDGSGITDGEPDAPSAVGNITLPFKKSFSVALNAIQTLWDAANSDPADFKYLRVKSDVGDPTNGFVILELTTDKAGAVGTQVYTVPLYAGIPFKLAGSASYAGYIANFAGGTLKKIDRLRVKNLNATTANVSIWMAN